MTTSTALRDDLLTQVQANTAITDEFTVTSQMGNVGVLNNVPYIRFVANDTTDHTVAVTFAEGDGSLTGSEFGTINDGSAPTAPTTVRLTYDSGITPSFQDIVLGEAANTTAIAATLVSMLSLIHI